MATPDLVAELRRLVTAEWTEMPAQTAQYRNRRLLEIGERLAAIERTKTWKGRDAG